jgi:amino acid transporter
MDADERVIVALGYKQEFKREFSLWTTFCVSFAVLGLLPSFASTLYYGKFSLQPTCWLRFPTNCIQGMGYAGTAGMVWGWIVAMVFIQCVAMSMAELCSAMPTR